MNQPWWFSSGNPNRRFNSCTASFWDFHLRYLDGMKRLGYYFGGRS